MNLFGLSLGLALTAGSVAAFNPCGFAMLPAYLGSFVAEPDASVPAFGRTTAPVRRALRVSLAMTTGFVLVFGAVGVLVESASVAVGEYSPWVTLVIGVALVPVGLAMLLGHEISVRLPRMQRGGAGGFGAHVLFGMSYATVSLSCTLPVFLTAVSGSFSEDGVASGVASFVAYSFGMGLVILTLTVALALARDGVVRRMRRIVPSIHRVAGVLLVLSGLYVTYYGYWELRVLRGDDVAEGPVAWVSTWSASMTDRVDSLGIPAVLVVLALLIGGAAWRSRHRSTAGIGELPPSTIAAAIPAAPTKETT